jgi:hypothetical protein
MGTCVFIISIIYTNNKLLLKVSWNINNKSLKMANGSPEAVNQTIQCSKDKVKNDKQWVTKHYKENKKIEHHNTRCRRHYGSKVNRSKKRHCICKHIETNVFIVAVMRISSLKEIFMNLLARKENDLWIHLSCKYWKHS